MDVKESVKVLKPYKANQVECRIKLDANEGKNYLFKEGFDLSKEALNLYPDTDSTYLRTLIANYMQVDQDEVLCGSGSSETIELIIKTYLEKDEYVIGFNPSFTMYKVYTTMHGGNYIEIPSEDDFSCAMDAMIAKAKSLNPKLIIICSPNNPTGYVFPQEEMIKLLENTQALVLIDEAYSEFSNQESFAKFINQYNHLYVTRTFSKAFGLAGARLGYVIGSKKNIEALNKVKTPYNINRLSQALGEQALKRIDEVKTYVNEVAKRRGILEDNLKQLGFTVYPSSANFLWVKSPIKGLYEALLKEGILIRRFVGEWDDYYRITVGTSEENQSLIKALKGVV